MPPAGYTPSGVLSLPPAAGTAAANRGGAPGRGAAAGARGGANAANRGGGNTQRQPVSAHIDHIAFTMKNWDKARVKVILESWGLFPTEDQDSYHVRDPFGFDLQISGPGMFSFPQGGKPATTTNNSNGNNGGK
jgi:hypothetical protein